MSGKSNKFDRNRKRSKSMAAYNAGGRDKVNKVKKLQRHLKKFPEDKKGIESLNNLKSGKPCPKATFPEATKPEERRRDSRMEQPVTEDWTNLDGLFFVVAVPERVLLCVTPHWSEALKQYVKTKTKSTIDQRVSGKFKTLRSQAAKS